MKSDSTLISNAFKKKYVQFLSIAVFIVILFAIFLVFYGSPAKNEQWVKVQKGDFIIDLVESGEIRAINSMFVRAPREWQIDLKIIDMIPEGSIVEKGDLLVQLDTSALEEELNQAQDELKQAEAELRSIDVQQASRIYELESNKKMAVYSKEMAEINFELLKYESKNRQEDARLELQKELLRFEEAEKKIETQKILDAADRQKGIVKVEQAKTSLELMKKRIDQLTLRAPISGMVVYQEIGGYNAPRYKASVGDNVRSGETVVSIPDLSKMQMVTLVNEMDAGSLKIGQKVIIRLDAFENSIYHGTVISVASLIEKMSGYWGPFEKAPSFEVRILIDEQDKMLKPGMTAQGRIILEEITSVLFVPAGAIFELEDSTTVVYTKRNYPNPVKVKLGKRNERFIIIEKGLHEGDEILWSPPTDEAHPLGWFAEMESRKTELKEFLLHIDTMNELGITNKSGENDSTQKKTQSPGVKEKKTILQ
jgi:RND family efflux transporter MFP subunit